METIFEKQIQFTRNVKAAGRLREFNFLKLKKTGGQTYHIDVADERGSRIEFNFLQDGENWRIVGDSVPAWVTDTAHDLELEIAANEHPSNG